MLTGEIVSFTTNPVRLRTNCSGLFCREIPGFYSLLYSPLHALNAIGDFGPQRMLECEIVS